MGLWSAFRLLASVDSFKLEDPFDLELAGVSQGSVCCGTRFPSGFVCPWGHGGRRYVILGESVVLEPAWLVRHDAGLEVAVYVSFGLLLAVTVGLVMVAFRMGGGSYGM